MYMGTRRTSGLARVVLLLVVLLVVLALVVLMVVLLLVLEMALLLPRVEKEGQKRASCLDSESL
jgi:hypothetical protein